MHYDADNWQKCRPEYAGEIFDRLEPKYYHRVLDAVALCWSQPGARLLEVGCAGGQNYNRLKARMQTNVDRDFTGLDVTPDYIAVARERIPQAKWVVGDARCLPFADNEFDVTFSMLMLLHLDKVGAAEAVREMCRVTKRNVFIHTYVAEQRYDSVIHEAMKMGSKVQIADDGRVFAPGMSSFLFNVMGLDELNVPGWRTEIMKCQNYLAAAIHTGGLEFVPPSENIYYEIAMTREV